MASSPSTTGHHLFLRWFGATFAAVTACIAAVNLTVNPLGYYSPRIFERPVWNSRREKMDLMLRATSSRPEVLILGSSRSMKIAPDDVREIAHRTAFNASVSSATVEDYYAMYRFATERCGWRPRVLLLGIDLDAFHDTRASVLPDDAPELQAYFDRGGRWLWRLGPLAKLLSASQVRLSGKTLLATVQGMPPPKHHLESDGFLTYADWDGALAAGTFHRDELDFEYYRSWHQFSRLSPTRVALFEKLLEETDAAGIEVRGFATPLHPEVYEDLLQATEYDRLHTLLVDELSQATARHPNARFVDLTVPSSYGGDSELFYDGVHQYRENARRMVVKALAEQ